MKMTQKTMKRVKKMKMTKKRAMRFPNHLLSLRRSLNTIPKRRLWLKVNEFIVNLSTVQLLMNFMLPNRG